MGRSRLLLGALIAALVSTLVAASGAAATPRPLAMGNDIVVLKGSAGAPGAVAAHQARTFRARVGYLYGSALKGYSATLPLADVRALRRDPSVAYVAEDRARLWAVRVLNAQGAAASRRSSVADFNGKPGGGARPTCRSDVDDTRADFSNFGPDVDLIAPGVCILSTFKAPATPP